MTLQQKEAMFLSASKFAVVGASSNSSKFGSKALKYLIEQHKDVVPINPKATEIQGLKCLKSLSELPDPTHTSVSVVVPPNEALAVLQQAKALGIPALWLQPGVADAAVVQYIADAQLGDRCIYTAPTPGAALHPAVRVAAALPTPGPCLFAYCTALQKKKDSSMDLGDEVPGLA
ncbi:CoA binding domain-containing protein [Mycena sp. CBHHK59/15]|nr:CoA binding domain-containing protein [Mycena sp. CBHHK59/15]